MNLNSRSDSIRYDDFLLLVLNNQILLASNSEMLPFLERASGAYTWNFDRVRGLPFSFEGKPYCVGAKNSCVVPGHDTAGAMKFNFDTQSVVPLAERIKGKGGLEFQVITTGDNDDKDCWHTHMEFDLEVSYIKGGAD